MKFKVLVFIASVMLSSLLMQGCASTYQMRSVEGSGFLKDYGQLTDRGGKTALLSYIDQDLDFREYNKILIDPIRAYAESKDSKLSKMSKEDQGRLLNYFDAALREQLKEDYILTDQPGPGVLRLRVAVTEARNSNVLLDTMSSVIPVGMAVSAVKMIATGKNLSVGEMGVECEGVDSQTGKRVFAAVDARVGRKFTGKFDKFNKWHTTEDAMDFWAKQLETGLSEERAAGSNR